MKKHFVLILVSAVIVLVSGCASVAEQYKPNAAYLQSRTANILGFNPDSVQISNIHEDDGITYYLADTPKGRYACHKTSGVMGVMAVVGIGVSTDTVSPMCQKQ